MEANFSRSIPCGASTMRNWLERNAQAFIESLISSRPHAQPLQRQSFNKALRSATTPQLHFYSSNDQYLRWTNTLCVMDGLVHDAGVTTVCERCTPCKVAAKPALSAPSSTVGNLFDTTTTTQSESIFGPEQLEDTAKAGDVVIAAKPERPVCSPASDTPRPHHT